MAEILAEAEFQEKRQSAKIQEEKLKIEEEYAKSKAKVKILEAIESEDHKREFNVNGQYKGEINKAIDEKPEIQHQGTKQYQYDQVTVGDGKLHFSFIKQPLHEKVKGNQANVTRWEPSKPIGERYKKVHVLDSEDVSEILCKLLKLQTEPEVDMEPFDGSVLKNHHFMALFKEAVESKVEDPRGRLIRLLKYTLGEAKELINHCIQLPSNEGFKYAKNLLEKVYGNPDKILASYRREIKQWPQIKFGDARAFQKFHTFLLKSRSMSFNQKWNALDSPDILCMLISKLPGGKMERWNRKSLNIRRCQVREPTLNDMTDFIEEETILMNDP